MQRKELELKKRIEDDKIMKMDLTSMSDRQRLYYEKMQDLSLLNALVMVAPIEIVMQYVRLQDDMDYLVEVVLFLSCMNY